MLKYIAKRLAVMIPSLLLVILIIFFMISNLPGSRQEFFSYNGGDALDRFFEQVGAQDNSFTQLIRYTYNIIAYGSFGQSDAGAWDIWSELAFRMKNTLKVAAPGFFFATFSGIPAGILAALKQNKWQDQAVISFATLMGTIPSFCLALFLVLFFSVYLNILPAFGINTWQGYIIPTLVLGAGGTAMAAKMTRASILDILSQPYIVTLLAKGLPDRYIILVHILKNALIPIISICNNTAIHVICGTLIVENFFTVPGIGTYLLAAVQGRHQHKVVGCSIFLAVLIMTINLVTDILYALVNPHLREKKPATANKGGGKQ